MKNLTTDSIWIAGKFRIIHKGHIDLLNNAYSISKNVHVAIVSSDKNDHYATAHERKLAFQKILKTSGIVGNVHVVDESKTKDTETWENELFKLEPKCTHIIDGKESYSNDKLRSIKITNYNDSISSTEIESNLDLHFDKINWYFKKFLVKKVLIAGIESVGKSKLTHKLASYYSTNISNEFGRKYDELYNPDIWTLRDFDNVLVGQQLSNIKNIENANRIFLIDTDAVYTEYFAIDKNWMTATKEEQELFKKNVETFIDNYDLVFYLKSNDNFVDDGFRDVADQETRRKWDEILLKKYQKAHKNVIVLENDNYTQTYHSVKEEILKKLKIS